MSGHELAPRLEAVFADQTQKKAALITYVTGGYPSQTGCARAVEAFIAGGADIVELGVPYSDPIADGPVVQRSAHEALLAGTTTDDVFALAAEYSAAVPFVVLTYVNSVLAYGSERFFARCADCGVEALVIPDLPVDEATALTAQAAARRVAVAPLAAPTSTDARLDLIAAAARSFIYCVSVTGVTGARAQVGDDLPDLLARLRLRTRAPLAVGFGISTPAQAAEVGDLADGVIVGSALIAMLGQGRGTEASARAVENQVRALAAALHVAKAGEGQS